MTNFEYYEKELEQAGVAFGVDKETGKVNDCMKILCDSCLFHGSGGCNKARMRWLREEHNKKIDLPEDIEVDAPILVSNDGDIWTSAHLHKVQNTIVWAWDEGRTSFTSVYSVPWTYAKLPDRDDKRDRGAAE